MYTDLCRCCAQPEALCKQADGEVPAQVCRHTSPNQYTLLETGDVEQYSDLPTESHSDPPCTISTDRDANGTAADAPTPRLISDSLEEAFALHKDIQVNLSKIAPKSSLTDISSRRRRSTCWLQREIPGGERQTAESHL